MELMYSEPLSVRTTSSGQPLCFYSMLMTSMVTSDSRVLLSSEKGPQYRASDACALPPPVFDQLGSLRLLARSERGVSSDGNEDEVTGPLGPVAQDLDRDLLLAAVSKSDRVVVEVMKKYGQFENFRPRATLDAVRKQLLRHMLPPVLGDAAPPPSPLPDMSARTSSTPPLDAVTWSPHSSPCLICLPEPRRFHPLLLTIQCRCYPLY